MKALVQAVGTTVLLAMLAGCAGFGPDGADGSPDGYGQGYGNGSMIGPPGFGGMDGGFGGDGDGDGD